MNIQAAKETLASLVDPELAKPTRIHKLPTAGMEPVYVKREDELSSGISGCKLRKFSSLLPQLRAKGVTELALIGGPNSNNLVGLVQLLKEYGMGYRIFAREAADSAPQGNALFLKLLVEPSLITIVQRSEWHKVERIAETALAAHVPDSAKRFVVPEGANCVESLPGGMTLASDILRNEHEHGVRFERIYIDSGTGMSAVGLILGLSLFDIHSATRHVKVTLTAGTEAAFFASLTHLQAKLIEKHDLPFGKLPDISFLNPPTARSFGTVNKTVMNACKEIARSEGLLMDPVYSVKHYMAMRFDLAANPSKCASLFVYNGSSLGLCGFQDQFAKL